MTIVKHVMSKWPGNDGKMTSHSNLKLRYSEMPFDVVFVSIWCDLRGLITRDNHLVENWQCLKKERLHWPDMDKKMTSHSSFKLRYSKTSLDVVRGFLFQFSVI